MTVSGAVHWGGIHNARDLGGLSGSMGTIQPGRLFRMPRPDDLDADGWGELVAAGVTTLVDLRNPDEIDALPMRPSSVESVTKSIEDPSDETFMAEYREYLGSPIYYAENLRRWPNRIAAAIAAVADAVAGGVVVHCAAGRDRTGLIVALVLEACGVDRMHILDDYELGVRQTNAHLRTQLNPRETPRSESALDAAIVDARARLAALLDSTPVEDYLTHSGMSLDQLRALRERLLQPG